MSVDDRTLPELPPEWWIRSLRELNHERNKDLPDLVPGMEWMVILHKGWITGRDTGGVTALGATPKEAIENAIAEIKD